MTMLRSFLDQPLRAYRVLGPALVAFFLLSAVSGNGSDRSDGWTYTVGAIGWAGFGLTLVVTVVFTAAAIGRSVLARRPEAG